MSRKLAVITGTFNSTTNAHLALADIAKESIELERMFSVLWERSGVWGA